jgi:hypothetical protein
MIDYDQIEAAFREQRELLLASHQIHSDDYEAAFRSYVENMGVTGDDLTRWAWEWAHSNLASQIETRVAAGQSPVLDPNAIVAFTVAGFTRAFTMGIVLGRKIEHDYQREAGPGG